METQRWSTTRRLSSAVRYGDVLQLTGQVAHDLHAGIATQVDQVHEAIDALLDRAGTNRSHIVFVQIWLRDLERDFSAMNRAWDAWFAGMPTPTRATSQALLAHPDLLVEYVVTAVVPSIDPRVRVDPTAWLAPSAVVEGDAEIAAEASVWHGAVVRADLAAIRLGEQSNVQDGCVLHGDPAFPAVIGARVSLGHRAVVHGATVEDDCLVGMGAVVMNGARIGGGSIVAAGAVVLEGTDVPPDSLMAGVPARVRRQTTEAERAHVVANAHTYVELAWARRRTPQV